MGHLVFLVLHLIAVLLGGYALLLTLPLHLIYGVLRPRAAVRGPFIPGPGDIRAGVVFAVHCPACREQVRSDALKCKHCGSELTPQSAKAPAKK